MLPLRLMGASSLDQETEGREAMVAPVRAVLSTLRRDSVDMIGRVYRRSVCKRRNYFCAVAPTLQRHSSRSAESLFPSFFTYLASSKPPILSSAFRYSTTTGPDLRLQMG